MVIIVLVSLRQTIVPSAMLGALRGGWPAAQFGLQTPTLRRRVDVLAGRGG